MKNISNNKKYVRPEIDLSQTYKIPFDSKKLNDSIRFYNKITGQYETGTPLHYFLLTDQFPEAKSLLEKYPDSIDINNQNNTYNCSALHLAIERNHIEMIAYIILLPKINVNLKSNDIAPLHLAVSTRNFQIVKMLVEAGADVNAEYKDPMSVVVVKNSTPEILEYLIVHGLNIHATGKNNHFALAAAVEMGNAEMVNTLLNNGADIEQKMDASYLHPQDKLVSAENEEQIDQDTALMIAVLLNHASMVAILLNRGADVAKKYYDLSLLHLAVCVENIDEKIIALLADKFIEKNLSIDAADILDETPLTYSIKKHLPKIVELLLKKGANINRPKHPELSTPLHIALMKSTEEVVNILINYKPSLLETDEKGNNVLHWAVEVKDLESIKIITSNDKNTLLQKNMSQKTPLDLLYENEDKIFVRNAKKYFKLPKVEEVTFNIADIFRKLSPLCNFVQENTNDFVIALKDNLELATFTHFFQEKITSKKLINFITISGNRISIHITKAQQNDVEQIFTDLSQELCKKKPETPPPQSDVGSPSASKLAQKALREMTRQMGKSKNNSHLPAYASSGKKKSLHSKNIKATESANNNNSSHSELDELFNSLKTSKLPPEIMFSATMTYFTFFIQQEFEKKISVRRKILLNILLKGSFRYLAETFFDQSNEIEAFINEMRANSFELIEKNATYQALYTKYWSLKGRNLPYLIKNFDVTSNEFNTVLKKHILRLKKIELACGKLADTPKLENLYELHIVAAILHELCVIGEYYSRYKKVKLDEDLELSECVNFTCNNFSAKFYGLRFFSDSENNNNRDNFFNQLNTTMLNLLIRFKDLVQNPDTYDVNNNTLVIVPR